MSKRLIVEIEGSEYSFALDRKEIVRAEKNGLRLREADDSPATQMTILWTIGLHKYQSNINEKVCSDLMDKYIDEGGDIQEVIEFLSGEYASFFQTTQTNSKQLKKARVIED